MRRRRIGEAIFARQKSNGAGSGEKHVRRPAGWLPAILRGSMWVLVPPTVTAAPHHGAALFQLWQRGARWGSVRRRARGGGCAHAVLTVAVLVDGIGAFQVQLMPWGRWPGPSRRSPRTHLRGPLGTPSPSPVAVSMSPWLSRSTWTCSSRNPFVHSQANHQQGAQAQCRAGNGDQRSRCQGTCSGGQQLTSGTNGHQSSERWPSFSAVIASTDVLTAVNRRLDAALGEGEEKLRGAVPVRS